MSSIANRITAAVEGLDRWFDSMRVDWPTPGYGGPVVHWWDHSLGYRATGLDWRYEGIIDGYMLLYRRSGEEGWLDKAIRAGLDLTSGQLPDGRFMNSGFERNPEMGGTPHEAAADIGLLLLAAELRSRDAHLSQRFKKAAERNLHAYWFGRLWHAPSMTLWDRPNVPSFVPNKAATFIEATLLLSDLTGDCSLIEQYARPTGTRILGMQIRRPGHQLEGAIAQNWYRGRVEAAYFPLYIARCVPPLLRLSEATGDLRFHDAALSAVRFLGRVRELDGAFPQVLYNNGRMNRFPRWIAGAGDIVRAMALAQEFGEEIDIEPTIEWILGGVRSDGRIATAEGFDRIVPFISRGDRFVGELGVVGWADKSFRALASFVDASELKPLAAATRRVSTVRG